MKLILPLLLIFTSFSLCVNAQLTLGGTNANFTIDADTKVGYSKYGPATATILNNDDWFRPSGYSGTGLGVLDTTGASVYRSKLQAKQNISFINRMANPMYTVNNGTLWLDAIYCRDYNVQYDALGNVIGYDSSGFTNSAKNALNPNSNWQGGNATFPNKTELIDGFVHMRRAGSSIYDSLWMLFGVSTLGVNGDRYYDIELFKKPCSWNTTTGTFTTTGTDGGHTAWKFDAAGNITQTGDIIIAVTYTPGAAPVIDFRIWVASTTYTTVNPTNFNFSGIFDGSGGYGYAQIVSNANNTAWGAGVGNYSATAVNDTTYSTPWGTSSLIGATNQWSQNYQRLQWVEIGLNLTRIGVDAALYTGQGINPCESAFYSVMMKSRSSSSFTANLQDFIGPVNFTTATITNYSVRTDTLRCNKTSGTINITNPYGQGIYTWSTPSGNISASNPDSSSIQVSQSGTYVLSMTPYAGCPTVRRDTVVVLNDNYPPVATAAAWTDSVISQIYLFGGDTAASNYSTPFGGSQGLQWSWSGPGGFTSAIQNPVTDTIWGTYQLIVTEKRNGCKDTAYIPLTLQILAVRDELTLNGNIAENKVNLYWEKLPDISRYTIEKSYDGRNFFVAAVINNAASNDLRYRDDIHSGVSYYRISYYNNYGAKVYSNIIRINSKDQNLIANISKFLQSPVIRISSDQRVSGELKIVVTNLNGQAILQKESRLNNETIRMNIDLPSNLNSNVLLVSTYLNNRLVSTKKVL